MRQTGAKGGLAGGGLTEGGREHVAHQNFIHLTRIHSGGGKGALDGRSTQLGSREATKSPLKGTDGGANATEDDHVIHGLKYAGT
ncbi:MAG: hypothetical protein Fur0036_16490 [Fimbriimonadaceae bacterium]